MFKPSLRIPRRPCLQRPSLRALAARRSLVHNVTPLDGEVDYNEHGIPKLLNSFAFNMAYTQYQKVLLDKLDMLVAGTEWEDKNVKDIVIGTARQPSLAPQFNYASMAFNNQFFFDGLTRGASSRDPAMTKELEKQLRRSFSSLESLKREFVLTADAMFGPGFVWLVMLKDRKPASTSHSFRILATYLAGSPFPGAHWREQGVDMNTRWRKQGNTGEPNEYGERIEGGNEPVRDYFDRQDAATGNPLRHNSHAQLSGYLDRTPGAVGVIPLLCVNTWEHVWLPDYGIGAPDEQGVVRGKRAFLENWWNRVNWGRVHELAGIKIQAFKTA